MSHQQGSQQQEFLRSQADARYGIRVLESAVTDHDTKLRPNMHRQETASSSEPTSTSVQYGQDDRGLGRHPSTGLDERRDRSNVLPTGNYLAPHWAGPGTCFATTSQPEIR